VPTPQINHPQFAFRCPPDLHDAMTAAARTLRCSRSDVIRQALVELLTDRGLLKDSREGTG
jgi:hypothetical protein